MRKGDRRHGPRPAWATLTVDRECDLVFVGQVASRLGPCLVPMSRGRRMP